jgi:four helix bundle protein
MQNPEDLKVWRKSHQLTVEVFKATWLFPWQRCGVLIKQSQSSALSIESNIAEGATRGGDIEFRRFLKIALGSAGELHTQLLVARDLGFLGSTAFDRLDGVLTEIRKMLWALIRRLGAL